MPTRQQTQCIYCLKMLYLLKIDKYLHSTILSSGNFFSCTRKMNCMQINVLSMFPNEGGIVEAPWSGQSLRWADNCLCLMQPPTTENSHISLNMLNVKYYAI